MVERSNDITDMVAGPVDPAGRRVGCGGRMQPRFPIEEFP
jgi:hypothetical protein